MFYSLSKALLFILQPAVWIVLLLAIALWSKRKRIRVRSIISAIVIFLVLGNSLVFHLAMSELEWPHQQEAEDQKSYAILLGGYGMFNSDSDGLELNEASDRLMAAIELYKHGSVEKILVSSGVYSPDRPTSTEASLTKDLLVGLGIPSADILVEGASWNTYENALYSSALIKDLGEGDSSYLITSAFHMKRAMACFEKQGLRPTPYPVDFHLHVCTNPFVASLVPSIHTLISWQVPFKEIAGTIVYRMKGYL